MILEASLFDACGNKLVFLNTPLPLRKRKELIRKITTEFKADGLAWIAGNEVFYFDPPGNMNTCGNACRIAAFLRKKSFTLTSRGRKIEVSYGKLPGVYLKVKMLKKYSEKRFLVNSGIRHEVIFVKSFSEIPLHIRNAGEKLLLSYDYVLNKGSKYYVRVFEDHLGESLSCGTGAAAIGFILSTEFKGKGRISLHFRGGTLFVSKTKKGILVEGKVRRSQPGQ